VRSVCFAQLLESFTACEVRFKRWIMRNNKERRTFIATRVSKNTHCHQRIFRVERRSGFVGQHESRATRKRARDRNALLLSDGEFFGQRIQAIKTE
jgi:hypothetical protein